ncbi:hypothetical protein ACFQ9X_45305 [Catenulispora yoronensis]
MAVIGALVAGRDFAAGMHAGLIGLAVLLVVTALTVHFVAPGKKQAA